MWNCLKPACAKPPGWPDYSDFPAAAEADGLSETQKDIIPNDSHSEGPLFQLSKDHAAFIESGVSIVVASRDSQNRPFLGRAAGCHVSTGGRIKILLSRRKYPFLLDAIRRTGAIAASFSEPSTNKSVQFKGVGAELAELEAGDADRLAGHLNLFAADVERMGIRGALPRAVLAAPPEDLTAVIFVPAVAFIQTPGPVAGTRIGG